MSKMNQTRVTPSMLKNAAAAPMIYFDAAPTFGVINSIVSVEVAAQTMMPSRDGQVSLDWVCIAHLRCSMAAAASLVEALTKAMTMAGVSTEPGQVPTLDLPAVSQPN